MQFEHHIDDVHVGQCPTQFGFDVLLGVECHPPEPDIGYQGEIEIELLKVRRVHITTSLRELVVAPSAEMREVWEDMVADYIDDHRVDLEEVLGELYAQWSADAMMESLE